MTDSWTSSYVRLVQHELPAEAFTGFQLAFLRPFAVPHMANILAASGAIRRDAEHRAYTTGLMIYEVIHGQLESPRARQVISRINRTHAGFSIADRDFAYVLDSFIVVPTRHMDRMGWRTTTEQERAATWRFYCRLAELMNIADPPTSFAHAVDRFDAYEAEFVAPSPATRELGALTLAVLQHRLPRPLQPLAPHLFSAQLNDPPVAVALGLPSTPRPLHRVVRLATATQGRLKARRHAHTPFFTPGQAAGNSYPDGYTLEQLLTN